MLELDFGKITLKIPELFLILEKFQNRVMFWKNTCEYSRTAMSILYKEMRPVQKVYFGKNTLRIPELFLILEKFQNR